MKSSTMTPFGKDVIQLVKNSTHLDDESPYKTLHRVVTHNEDIPLEHAENSLSLRDLQLFKVVQNDHFNITYKKTISNVSNDYYIYEIYVNALGRPHIRPTDEDKPIYFENDTFRTFGFLCFNETANQRAKEIIENAETREIELLKKLRADLEYFIDRGELEQIVDGVISHVQRVESVGFYLKDKLYTMLERSENLVNIKKNNGKLKEIASKDYEQWSDEDALLIIAIQALYLSGRSVRIEEFNGMTLSATALIEKFRRLIMLYSEVGCNIDFDEEKNILETAKEIRECTISAIGKPWLRYRWIYALNFFKTEKIVSRMKSSERELDYFYEFYGFYISSTGKVPDCNKSEQQFFSDIAASVIQNDLNNVPCAEFSRSATSWTELFIEKVVYSAVKATSSDYGMSSSLQCFANLVQPDETALLDIIHQYKPTDFFTCFVADISESEMDKEELDNIAKSVQRRMMFNRWHFIPGNFGDEKISNARHWYYPPLIPDIAIYSNVHREAHAKAKVKYSVRAPGPDMSQPPLVINERNYRGFYDVRVVRIEGPEYTEEEMLRTRRRTLWLGILFDELVKNIAKDRMKNKLVVRGFQVGEYYNPSYVAINETSDAASVAGEEENLSPEANVSSL